MIKETKYIEIHYTDKDIDYINSLIDFIEKSEEEIVSFFDIENFGIKVMLYLFDDLDCFRKSISTRSKRNEVPEWLCGYSFVENNKFIINTLCLQEYKKTMGHANYNLKDLEYLVMHEFVHSCQQKYIKFNTNVNRMPRWFIEGMATFVSHQYDNTELSFDATLEEMIKGNTKYSNYYAMFLYVYNNYGKKYILELLENCDKLINETPYLFEEARKYYDGCIKINKEVKL